MSTSCPPAPGQYPQPVTPAKKGQKWPWIFGVVIFLIAMSALSNADKQDKKSETAASVVPTTEAEAPVVATLNTPVRDGKFEFIVRTVQPGLPQVGDNPYLQQNAQGQFVIVTLSVQNIGDRAQGFSPDNQKLFDTNGRSFETDASAQIALGDSDIPVWDNINPGNAVNVKLVYDMPQGAAPTRIELHDSMFSGGVTVNLTP